MDARPRAAGGSMPAWASRLMALRRAAAGDPAGPIGEAIAEARAAGTALVGDVTNTLAAYEPLADSGLGGRGLPRAARVRRGGSRADRRRRAGRARRADAARRGCGRRSCRTRRTRCRRRCCGRSRARAGDAPISVHLGESPRRSSSSATAPGRGASCSSSSARGTTGWEPPACGPVEYLDRLGLVTGRAARGARRAAHGRGARAPGGGRRDGRDLSAEQSVDRRRRAADRALLRARACASRSAPTAWRASRT